MRRWNWKSGVTSALIRGGIYFATNLRAGAAQAAGAMLAEFGYRTLLSGANGSVTEALRRTEPAWAATLSAAVILPLASHAIEFMVHYLRGTPRLGASLIASVTFTVLSTLFNLYAMRHGVLVVGEGRRSLADDFRAMPRIVVGFLTAGLAGRGLR
ncbi:MAG: hypothetical protein JSU00_13825 [Acidobacteria bacterium]|nr:hypothetical protein [Acidobacteriota bacterium]